MASKSNLPRDEDIDDNLYGQHPSTDKVNTLMDPNTDYESNKLLVKSQSENEESSTNLENVQTKHKNENKQSKSVTQTLHKEDRAGNSMVYKAGTGAGVPLNNNRDGKKSKISHQALETHESKETLLRKIEKQRNEIDNLNKNVKDYTEQITNLEERCSNAIAEREKTKKINATITKKVTDAEKKCKETVDELQKIKVINEQLTAENGKLKKDKLEQDTLSNQKTQELEQQKNEFHICKTRVTEAEKKYKEKDDELQQIKVINEQLTAANSQLENDKLEQESLSSQKAKALEQQKNELLLCKTSLKKAEEKITSKDIELQELKAIHEQLTKENEELKQSNLKLQEYTNSLKKKSTDLATKLSEEWNNKVASDECNLENISIKNRPVNIAGDYANLCSNAWLDMKNQMDNICSDSTEEEKLHVLREIIMKCEKVSTTRYTELCKVISTSLLNPAMVHNQRPQPDNSHVESEPKNIRDEVTTSDENAEQEDMEVDDNDAYSKHTGSDTPKSVDDVNQPVDESTENKESTVMVYQRSTQPADKQTQPCDHIETRHLPEGLMNSIGDYIRCEADDTNLSDIVKDVIGSLFTQTNLQMSRLSNTKGLNTYIQACARVTWKMAIQRPPMSFKIDGINEKWREGSQELHYIGDDPKHPDARVQYYIYPTLVHGDKVMSKGRVCVKIQKTENKE